MNLEAELEEVLHALHRQEIDRGVIWRLFQNEPDDPVSGWRIAGPLEVPPDVQDMGWLRHKLGVTVSIRPKGNIWEIGATLFPFSFASYAKPKFLAETAADLCWSMGQVMNIQRAKKIAHPALDDVVRAQQEYLANRQAPPTALSPEEALAMAEDANFEID